MKFLHSFLRRHLAGKSVRRQMSAVFSGYSESSDQNFFVYILYYLLIISYHMKSYHIISYHIISYHIYLIIYRLTFARFYWLFWVTWYQVGGQVSGNTPRPCRYLPYDFSVARKHDTKSTK